MKMKKCVNRISRGLMVYTITRRGRRFFVHPFAINREGTEFDRLRVIECRGLKDARSYIPNHLKLFEREEADGEAIVESWL